MKTLRLDVKIRNHRLVKAREDLGLSQAEAARRIGIQPTELSSWENCRQKPMGKGVWRKQAMVLADYYGYSPEYLWSEEIRALKKRAATLFMDGADVQQMMNGPEQMYLDGEDASIVRRALATLPVKERAVIKERLGGATTLRHVSRSLKVSRERARQIEHEAINRLTKDVLLSDVCTCDKSVARLPTNACVSCGRMVRKS